MKGYMCVCRCICVCVGGRGGCVFIYVILGGVRVCVCAGMLPAFCMNGCHQKENI